MLREWFEIGIGNHITEEVVLSTASFSDYEEIKSEFKRLNSITERHGTRYSIGDRGKDGSCVLRITVLSDVLKRNAGPKRKQGRLRRIGEVFAYQEKHGSLEASEFAGVHIRSFQRRVKRYREEGKWNAESRGFF